MLGVLIIVVALGIAAVRLLSSPTHPATVVRRATPTPVAGAVGPPFPHTSPKISNQAGINPEPGMRPSQYVGPNPDGWFCRVPHCADGRLPLSMVSQELRLMARLHVGVVRVEFPWPLIERRQDKYSWARTDAIVNDANRYHLQLQPVLVYTPAWAGPGFTQAPTSAALWSSFVRSIVHRYKNSVHYWEMWNEPDAAYWLSGSQSYVQDILIPGAAAAKAADPTARVLLGAPYFADMSFLNDVYRYGGGTSFDIIGFHEYANVLSATAIQQDVDAVQGVLDSHGDSSRPIWIGEYGYNEPSEMTDDANHIMALRIMLQQVVGYQEAIWYNLRDDDAMTCCPLQTIKVAHWGLVQRDDRTLKQGYAVMRKLLRALTPPAQ